MAAGEGARVSESVSASGVSSRIVRFNGRVCGVMTCQWEAEEEVEDMLGGAKAKYVRDERGRAVCSRTGSNYESPNNERRLKDRCAGLRPP